MGRSPVIGQTMKKGRLFVISGPSGSGKGTICGELLSGAGVGGPALSVSVTTRKPRPGEKDGVSYHFVTEDVFRALIDEGGFLEYAEVFGGFYGTPKSSVTETLDEGRDVLLEIDVQGAMQVKRNYPESILVFILPPSLGDLRKRIEGRGSESDAQIAQRVGEAAREVGAVVHYDYAVVNDDIGKAVAEIKDILEGRHAVLTKEEATGIAARFKADAAKPWQEA
jgi:guanylate kinase